uniref:Uncharacterized protein n=1 Tax=Lepeophtheirus salmonis TaxID=72036 RepID=A0A0K2V7C8_LEPSM
MLGKLLPCFCIFLTMALIVQGNVLQPFKRSAFLRHQLHGGDSVPLGIRSRLKFFLESEPSSFKTSVLKYAKSRMQPKLEVMEEEEPLIPDIEQNMNKLRYAVMLPQEEELVPTATEEIYEEPQALLERPVSISRSYSRYAGTGYGGSRMKLVSFLPRPPMVL